MVKNCRIDDEDPALAELRRWCSPLGLEPRVHEYSVNVVWHDAAKNRIVPVAHEDRNKTGSGKRVSVQTTCRKLINRIFKAGSWLYWTKDRTAPKGAYEMRTEETVCLKLPPSDSPAELELKLAARGWTGNPFGRG